MLLYIGWSFCTSRVTAIVHAVTRQKLTHTHSRCGRLAVLWRSWVYNDLSSAVSRKLSSTTRRDEIYRLRVGWQRRGRGRRRAMQLIGMRAPSWLSKKESPNGSLQSNKWSPAAAWPASWSGKPAVTDDDDDGGGGGGPGGGTARHSEHDLVTPDALCETVAAHSHTMRGNCRANLSIKPSCAGVCVCMF